MPEQQIATRAHNVFRVADISPLSPTGDWGLMQSSGDDVPLCCVA
jgi:hypothetical protein